jgi:pyruvate/2-oxoglutarate/acetoin dehydrogenase E1 component
VQAGWQAPVGGGKQLAATNSQDDDPVILLKDFALYSTKGEVPDGDQVTEIGRAAVVKPGSDLTVVAYSRATVIALDVPQRILEELLVRSKELFLISKGSGAALPDRRRVVV